MSIKLEPDMQEHVKPIPLNSPDGVKLKMVKSFYQKLMRRFTNPRQDSIRILVQQGQIYAAYTTTAQWLNSYTFQWVQTIRLRFESP